MNPRLPLALLLAATLAGCAATQPAHKVDLASTCIGNIAELPVTPVYPLAADSKQKVRPRDYSEVAHCVESAEGQRMAAALFRLEEPPMPANLRVVMSERAGEVLAAAVTTMDENFVVIGRTGFDRFVNRGTSNTVDVVLNDPRVRYVLITPDDAQVGKSEKQFRTQTNTATIPVGAAMVTWTSGAAQENMRAYSDAGFISLFLTPATPATVGGKM